MRIRIIFQQVYALVDVIGAALQLAKLKSRPSVSDFFTFISKRYAISIRYKGAHNSAS